MKVVLIIVGCALFAIGAIGTFIIVDMFQHPRGIGAEWIVGPLLGIVVLAFLCASFGCFYAAKRMN